MPLTGGIPIAPDGDSNPRVQKVATSSNQKDLMHCRNCYKAVLQNQPADAA